ncbi:hypothetical protein GCM10017786_75150 [Amycolatopsis deserti]|uniref:PASTA domain-containing protein n=1 Tax=Amycolatopsis deserti TaxID=185696 RepID=A0ABQ3JHW2_9PSEU|nr:hypothetical protein [Amycolatopsis deserti]GHF30143.1 hypothetical protein GCM10017786_75150 [Amycolatopsis deserti]
MSTAFARPETAWNRALDIFHTLGVGIRATGVQGVYSRTVRVPFGQPVEVGDPFAIRLETAEF